MATPDYKIVNVEDKEFRVYDNGTVTDEFDVFIVEGGVPALTEYLTENPILLLYQDQEDKFLGTKNKTQSTLLSTLGFLLTMIIVLSVIFYYQITTTRK